MKQFVFWTGMISVLSGAGFQVPAFGSLFMPSVPPGMLVHLFGAMAMFLGVMLVACSRDLKARGTVVAWEGVLRLGGFAIMGTYGIFGDGGVQLVVGGLVDMNIGVIYLVGLPRHLGVPLIDVLLDKQTAA